MILQIACPADNDPFFNTPACGGVSTCIVINKGVKPDTLPNCVACAWGCYNKAANNGKTENMRRFIDYPPDAGRKWINRATQAGLLVSQYPTAGAVAVWGKKANLDTGHVAFIYRVDNDGTVYTSESEYNGRKWVNRTYKPPYAYGAAYTFLGFIHQPETKHPVLKEGSKGADVKSLQQLLIKGKYMRPNEADGDFGKITKGAVCCYQLENGLTVDGVCGAKTWAKIDK